MIGYKNGEFYLLNKIRMAVLTKGNLYDEYVKKNLGGVVGVFAYAFRCARVRVYAKADRSARGRLVHGGKDDV